MKQIALKYFTNSELTLIALVLFLLSFAFLIFRVYIYDSKEKFDQLSQIPLNDEEARCERG